MKRLAQEIVKGKNIKENLPEFARKMMGIYSDYSFIRLAMNYYTYCEMLFENDINDERLNEITKAFNDIIKKAVEDEHFNEWEALLAETKALRDQVMDIMKGLFSYTDIFNIYEYCLNRVEYRFKEAPAGMEKSSEELTEELITYILSDRDSYVMNGRISEIVRQLPVRMTKNKFFELIRAGIGVYKGSEIASVEDYLFLLKTNAMIEISPYTDLISEDIRLIYDEFGKVSFSDITKEQYNDLRQKSDFAAGYLPDIMDLYTNMCELINDMCVILMTKTYASNASDISKEEAECREIIKCVVDVSDAEVFDDEYDKMAEKFIKLEGKQEMLQNKFSSYEYVTEQVLNEHSELLKDLKLEDLYTSLKHMEAFESGNIFMEFNEKNTSPADEQYLNTVTEQFIAQLKDFFGSHERLVNRAVMAHILSDLPVFFNRMEEVESYILNSFNQCSDLAEKAAVREIIELIMEDGMPEDYMYEDDFFDDDTDWEI